MSVRISEWAKLPVSLTELCLATTLRCGQSFRWKQLDDQTWTCVLRGRVVQLDQDETHLKYRSIWPAAQGTPPTPPASQPPEDADDTEALLQHYLNLSLNLENLYQQWSKADQNFQKKAPKFAGVRILRQDAWEALVSFICSSNNNIVRISQMVEKLCIHYGKHVATWQGKAYHDFPVKEALAGKNVEAHLRQLGFGYRAKYIVQTAQMLSFDREKDWLETLHNPESPAYGQRPTSGEAMIVGGRPGYQAAHEKLLELQGVGPKVADCVCLMGLGWGEAVPVDTHVWQIAQRDYKIAKGRHASLTKATYDAVANHFRKIWGQEAGWAHSVLFAADLKVFAGRLQAAKVIKQEADSQEVKIETTEIVSQPAVGTAGEVERKRIVEVDETTLTSTTRSKRRRGR